MSNEIALPANNIAEQIEFAQLVTTRPEGQRPGQQSILPEAYRDNPANVLVAVGLGSAMGLSFAESLYRIAVIKGKPSASAELIAANVRKAGHKLRVRVQENPPVASCTIVRADDPDEPLTIERDMAWAQRMGLAGEPNYKKQPATMLSYRAITACARLACPEALYGVSYTPDEAASLPDETVAPAPQAAASDFLKAEPASRLKDMRPVAETQAEPTADEVTGEVMASDAQRRAMFAAFGEHYPDARTTEGREMRLDYLTQTLGREVHSSNDLTADECSRVIDALRADPTQGEPAPWDEGA